MDLKIYRLGYPIRASLLYYCYNLNLNVLEFEFGAKFVRQDSSETGIPVYALTILFDEFEIECEYKTQNFVLKTGKKVDL